jgi:hypothetical protein
MWVLQYVEKHVEKRAYLCICCIPLIKANNINIKCHLNMHQHGMRHVSTFYYTMQHAYIHFQSLK